MPLHRYGILKGKAVDSLPGTTRSNHFQIRILAKGEDHRIAINVLSNDTKNRDLQFLVIDSFKHPVCDRIRSLPEGFTAVASEPGGMALDFIRGNLFDINQMQILPPSQDGPDNDLNDKIGFYVDQAKARRADVYAFGEKWGPEASKPDQYFGFRPGNGIHDIHMNQGNPPGPHAGDNGVWQDGAVLIHFPEDDRWVAYFLKFQSQTVHTEEPGGETPEPGTPGGTPGGTPIGGTPELTNGLRILAALVNPAGEDAGTEQVLLFNPLSKAVSLDGWGLLDSQKRKETLSGQLASGETKTVHLSGKQAQLANKGGIITLVDQAGLKIHGVSYTQEQVRTQGEWVVF
ncbi:DUF2278 family protein [Spirosoma sp. KUDC1026]|uniref:DUF2278 family protein n=1 Tax=Spirosoma sp. KUDC1026 TaxID=2745947 RepID=UPI00159BE36F|nr:DUF2278 family protein [Spirosoma sp. KUDC1026]QKZ13544.1 DUF2278 family protein [Spirosoma sp. KUDC1026]